MTLYGSFLVTEIGLRVFQNVAKYNAIIRLLSYTLQVTIFVDLLTRYHSFIYSENVHQWKDSLAKLHVFSYRGD